MRSIPLLFWATILVFLAIFSRAIITASKGRFGLKRCSNAILSTVGSDIIDIVPHDDSFIPPDVGLEIYTGSIISLVPIVWAAIEFNNRIQTQRNCKVCKGCGLVKVTKNGVMLSRQRKCWNCGGFLPWLGWKMFFFSAMSPGNGGVLRRPSPDYEETNVSYDSKSSNETEKETEA